MQEPKYPRGPHHPQAEGKEQHQGLETHVERTGPQPGRNWCRESVGGAKMYSEEINKDVNRDYVTDMKFVRVQQQEKTLVNGTRSTQPIDNHQT